MGGHCQLLLLDKSVEVVKGLADAVLKIALLKLQAAGDAAFDAELEHPRREARQAPGAVLHALQQVFLLAVDRAQLALHKQATVAVERCEGRAEVV